MGNSACQECSNLEDNEPVLPASSKINKINARAITLKQKEGSQINYPEGKASTSSVAIGNGRFQLHFMGGCVYEGQASSGLREGQGTQTWPDGSRYEGQWNNDKMAGEGIYTSSKIDCKGTFANNQLVKGQVILKEPRKQTYEGELKDNLYHGLGELSVDGISHYKGTFNRHLKEGTGILTLNSGEYYEGEFKGGLYEGKGMKKTNDYHYNGQFVNGKFHGEGRCVWKNGTQYKGSYINGQKQGYGQYRYLSGNVYKGMWHKGKPQEDSQLPKSPIASLRDQ